MKRMLILVALLVATLMLCSACSYTDGDWEMAFAPNEIPNYVFEEVPDNGFVSTAENATSYFSLDRNTSSYSVMRRQLQMGLKIAPGSVRLEEYINYFNYNYSRPTSQALALGGNRFPCPWNTEHMLFSIGVAAEEVQFSAQPNNVVMLIDTSGSMDGERRLGLIQQAMTMLVENLSENDIVSIVTYAGTSSVALDGARGCEKTRITNVLQDLIASGSTNGEGGIQTAYALAEKYFIQGGNNRVILATDGDFNVGITDKNQLATLVGSKKNSGIYLSVLGVGMFNTNDTTMKTLAENGNGNYAYLDSVSEARKVLVTEFNGTFNVVAKDAKIGVEFNPDVVDSYRLIGYESKTMSQEEFDDQEKDAGEIGSGHTVTAVYEISMKNTAGTIATAEVRYKHPTTNQSQSVRATFTTENCGTISEDSVFIGCVVEFGLFLRQSEYMGNADLAAVAQRLSTLPSVVGENADQFRAEFLQLVLLAQQIYSD